MSDWTDAEVKTTLQKILKTAMTDGSFRKLCLTDSAAAIRKISGKDVPKGLKIRFVDNAGADRTFVLPDLKEDLSDEDLEKVAGGTSTFFPFQDPNNGPFVGIGGMVTIGGPTKPSQF